MKNNQLAQNETQTYEGEDGSKTLQDEIIKQVLLFKDRLLNVQTSHFTQQNKKWLEQLKNNLREQQQQLRASIKTWISSYFQITKQKDLKPIQISNQVAKIIFGGLPTKELVYKEIKQFEIKLTDILGRQQKEQQSQTKQQTKEQGEKQQIRETQEKKREKKLEKREKKLEKTLEKQVQKEEKIHEVQAGQQNEGFIEEFQFNLDFSAQLDYLQQIQQAEYEVFEQYLQDDQERDQQMRGKAIENNQQRMENLEQIMGINEQEMEDFEQIMEINQQMIDFSNQLDLQQQNFFDEQFFQQ